MSCGPSCVTPTCIQPISSSSSYPIGSIGSLGSGCGELSLGGGGVSASSLGILPGAAVGCLTQAPPSAVLIQRQPIVVTLPGPVLSCSCEPVRVGGYSACSGGGSSGGYLSSGSGLLGSKRSVVCRPC